MTSIPISSQRIGERALEDLPTPDGGLQVIEGGALSAPVDAANSDALPLSMQRDEDADMANPDAIALSHPELSVAMAATMASFDLAVPSWLVELHWTAFRNAEMNGEFSMNNAGGPLTDYFRSMFVAPENPDKPDGDDDDAWDDYIDLAHDREEKRIEHEIEETRSQSDLDAIPWQGDPNEVWDIDGISASRQTIYNSAKTVRKNIGTLAAKNHWTDAERADQTYWLSEIDRRAKANDKEGVAEIVRDHLKPETRAAFDNKAKAGLVHDHEVSEQSTDAANKVSANAEVSTDAQADMLDQASRTVAFQPARVITASKEPSLSHPPAIELTEEFTVAAAADTARPLTAPAPVQLASATPSPTAAAPTLNQDFSL